MTLRQAKYLTLDDLLIETAFRELYQQAALAMRYPDFHDNNDQVVADIRRELNERHQQKSI